MSNNPDKITVNRRKHPLQLFLILSSLALTIHTRITYSSSEDCAKNYKYCTECISNNPTEEQSICKTCSLGHPMSPGDETNAYNDYSKSYRRPEFIYECQDFNILMKKIGPILIYAGVIVVIAVFFYCICRKKDDRQYEGRKREVYKNKRKSSDIYKEKRNRERFERRKEELRKIQDQEVQNRRSRNKKKSTSPLADVDFGGGGVGYKANYSSQVQVTEPDERALSSKKKSSGGFDPEPLETAENLMTLEESERKKFKPKQDKNEL